MVILTMVLIYMQLYVNDVGIINTTNLYLQEPLLSSGRWHSPYEFLISCVKLRQMCKANKKEDMENSSNHYQGHKIALHT